MWRLFVPTMTQSMTQSFNGVLNPPSKIVLSAPIVRIQNTSTYVSGGFLDLGQVVSPAKLLTLANGHTVTIAEAGHPWIVDALVGERLERNVPLRSDPIVGPQWVGLSH
jgi:hypothetical protein